MDVEAAKGTIWKQIKSIAFGAESDEDKRGKPDPQKPAAADKNTDETW